MRNRRKTNKDDGRPTRRSIEEVRRIVFESLRGCDVRVFLFGSWARKQAKRTSDIDVALDPHHPLPPGTVARLRDQLEESHVPYRVEIVDLSDVDPAFRKRVLEEGIRWSDSTSG